MIPIVIPIDGGSHEPMTPQEAHFGAAIVLTILLLSLLILFIYLINWLVVRKDGSDRFWETPSGTGHDMLRCVSALFLGIAAVVLIIYFLAKLVEKYIM